jgi:hypothetical protein
LEFLQYNNKKPRGLAVAGIKKFIGFKGVEN